MSCLLRPILACALPALLLAMPVQAWAKSDTHYWASSSVSVKLNDKFVLTNDSSVRSSDAKGFYQAINHFMVGYKADKHITLTLGYTADFEHSHDTFTTTENRFRQQIASDQLLMIGRAKLSGKVRLEERWRDGFAGTGWRMVPGARLAIPLGKKLMLNLSEDVFFDLNTTGFQKTPGLDRTRNAVALGMPLAKHFTLELGYMEQHGFVPAAEDTDDHVMTAKVIAAF